jgi:hypothetical protein
MWEDVAKSTSSVEVWFQGTCVDGFLDPSGPLVALRVEACHVLRAEVVFGGAGVLTHGGLVFVCVAFDLAQSFLVVLLEAGVHGAFGLADVGGVAWVSLASGAWDVVNQR